ncbi:YrhB domain-containing protein [Streptomyces sp. NPDC054863]
MSPSPRAAAWLNETYQGLVELQVPEPVHETPVGWLFACRTLHQPGYPQTPMLAASVVVPKDGSRPFHPSPSAPLQDLAPAASQDEALARAAHQPRRINARGCLVTLHAMIGGGPSTPLPWQPSDEAPGWWSRLRRRYFPEFVPVPVSSWDDAVKAMAETGPDTRGVVWVRREAGGHEITGNLLYAHNNKGQVVFLDGLTSSLARLDTDHVRELLLLRAVPQQDRAPWERDALDFEAARDKARQWLDSAYGGEVELVEPGPGDETQRGWVFSCDTRRHLREGLWQDVPLDATVVVPKEPTAPFHLPNSMPWAWLAHWDRGGQVGTDAFPLPPAPGRAYWFEPTLNELGPVLATSDHRTWQSAVTAADTLPPGARSLLWARRTDGRGREAVGLLVTALTTESGVVLVDGSSDEPFVPDETGLLALHLIRYR